MEALIITDQPLVAIGLRTALTKKLPVRRVVIDRSLVVGSTPPPEGYGLVLFDLDARRSDRITVLEQLRHRHPAAALAAFTAAPSDGEAEEATRAGACVYLSKSCSLDALSDALADAVPAPHIHHP